MNTQTIDVKKTFKALIGVARLTYEAANTNEYYKLEEIFREALRKFLHHDLSDLSKNDLLILCDLVSRHRPVPLHTFIGQLGRLAKNRPQL
jgi:hypothetical protein